MKPTVIDLFCGVGGFSLGAARAGFNVIASIDNNNEALWAHEMNFPNARHINADIRLLVSKDIVDPSKNIDGLIGGPPCQGFSSIGKNNASDPRNALFGHFFRIASALQPKFFIAENVPGILNEKNDSIRKRAFAYVENHYTMFPPMVLSACDFGAATMRKRAFFIGIRKDVKHTFNPLVLTSYKTTNLAYVQDALRGLPQKIRSTWQTEEDGWRKISTLFNSNLGNNIFHRIPRGVGNISAIKRLHNSLEVSGCLGTIHSEKVLERISRLSPGEIDSISRAPRLNPIGFCPTLRAGTGKDHGSFQAVRPFHPFENRVITPREAARLQGFPDWYIFSPTKWQSFRQIGNSVSPILAEAVIRKLSKTLI